MAVLGRCVVDGQRIERKERQQEEPLVAPHPTRHHQGTDDREGEEHGIACLIRHNEPLSEVVGDAVGRADRLHRIDEILLNEGRQRACHQHIGHQRQEDGGTSCKERQQGRQDAQFFAKQEEEYIAIDQAQHDRDVELDQQRRRQTETQQEAGEIDGTRCPSPVGVHQQTHPIERQGHKAVGPVFRQRLVMKPEREIDAYHHGHHHVALPTFLQEDGAGLEDTEEDACIEQHAQPEHSNIAMRTEQIADAIDEPEQRPFAVGKVDIGRQAVHPGFPAHIEPCGVHAVEQIVCVGIGRTNEQHGKCQKEKKAELSGSRVFHVE